MGIEVHRDRCIGAGRCVITAPDWFDQDDDGLVVLTGTPRTEESSDLLEAVDLCPSGALSRSPRPGTAADRPVKDLYGD